jgi:hypothetical protein
MEFLIEAAKRLAKAWSSGNIFLFGFERKRMAALLSLMMID